ncbi:MAG TPA: L-erythro-3,5-diaminohexanoate dehydrogenase, partial [Anaeromyxobacteraceae bacterium]
MDPYGLRRVVTPRGALPQRAEVLDPHLPLGEDEVLLDVEALNVDAASFRQLEAAAGGDEGRIAEELLRIVRARGKLHNPVTGSGGMLVGRVREVGPRSPHAGTLAPGDEVATLVSLTLTPLALEAVERVDLATDRADVRGHAIV